MEEKNNKISTKIKALLILIAATIISIIIAVVAVPEAIFEKLGLAILVIFTTGIVYAIVKLFSGKKSKSTTDKDKNTDSSEIKDDKTKRLSKTLLIILGIVALFLLVFSLIASNPATNKIVGMIAISLVIVLIAVYIWYKIKDWV